MYMKKKVNFDEYNKYVIIVFYFQKSLYFWRERRKRKKDYDL